MSYLNDQALKVEGVYHSQLRNMMVISSIGFVLFNIKNSFMDRYSYTILVLSSLLLCVSITIALKSASEYKKKMDSIEMTDELRKDTNEWLFFPICYSILLFVLLSIIILRKVLKK